MRLVLATRNRGKVEELRALLEPVGFELVDLDEAGIAVEAAEDEVEGFPTFEENALAKARHFRSRIHTRFGRVGVLADDSGLEVRALGGRPGVRSKRFSGRADLAGRALDAANHARLLAELEGREDRFARFVCAAAYVASDGTEIVERGVVDGRILDAPRGSEGFGYDPLFYATELGRTFGEAGVVEKERVSHRARAFGALLPRVLAHMRAGPRAAGGDGH